MIFILFLLNEKYTFATSFTATSNGLKLNNYDKTH